MVKKEIRVVKVDLVKGMYDCGVFQLSGIPCEYAIASIHNKIEKPINYIGEYYKREFFLLSCSCLLETLSGEEYWEYTSGQIILPPEIPKKLRGMPKR